MVKMLDQWYSIANNNKKPFKWIQKPCCRPSCSQQPSNMTFTMMLPMRSFDHDGVQEFHLLVSSRFLLRPAILDLRSRLSTSICFSPIPFTRPPACRSKCVHMRVSLGNWYWHCANSTWIEEYHSWIIQGLRLAYDRYSFLKDAWT